MIIPHHDRQFPDLLGQPEPNLEKHPARDRVPRLYYRPVGARSLLGANLGPAQQELVHQAHHIDEAIKSCGVVELESGLNLGLKLIQMVHHLKGRGELREARVPKTLALVRDPAARLRNSADDGFLAAVLAFRLGGLVLSAIFSDPGHRLRGVPVHG